MATSAGQDPFGSLYANQDAFGSLYNVDPKLKFSPSFFKFPQLDNNAWLADPSFKIDPKTFLNNKFSYYYYEIMKSISFIL